MLKKYYTIILSLILIVWTIIESIKFEKLTKQIESEGLIIDLIFVGWEVLFSFIMIALYEQITKHKKLKSFIKILLTIILFGAIFKYTIPIADFDVALEYTTMFLGLIAIIFLIILGGGKLYSKLFE